LRNTHSAASDTAKAKQCGHKRNDKKDYSVMKHDFSFDTVKVQKYTNNYQCLISLVLFDNAQTILVSGFTLLGSLILENSEGIKMNTEAQTGDQSTRLVRISSGVMVLVIISSAHCFAQAKLPEATQAEKALMQQNIARQTLLTKQDTFENCVTQNKIVKKYQDSLRAQGKAVPVSVDTGPCADPGTFKADGGTPIVNRPIEASEAHSPTGTAVSPPSSKTPQSELPIKK
jgi:hypothetical protein